MFREQGAGLLHAVNDARRKFGLAKIAGHGVGQLPPECISAFLMNRFIADDGKFMRTRRNKNQYSVPFARFVHSQAHELYLGRGDGIVNVFGADADADFAGRFALGIADGRDNIVVLQMF